MYCNFDFEELAKIEPIESNDIPYRSTKEWLENHSYSYEVTTDYRLHLHVNALDQLFKLLGTKLNVSIADLNDLANVILNNRYILYNNREENGQIANRVALLIDMVLDEENFMNPSP